MVMAVVEVLRVGAAAVVALDPCFAAIGVALFFPDGETVFHVVDNVATSEEGVAPMVCGDADPDCDVADLQRANAVHNGRCLDLEFFGGFGDDLFGDRRSELCIATVVKLVYGFAFVMIAHPALVAAEGACCL